MTWARGGPSTSSTVQQPFSVQHPPTARTGLAPLGPGTSDSLGEQLSPGVQRTWLWDWKPSSCPASLLLSPLPCAAARLHLFSWASPPLLSTPTVTGGPVPPACCPHRGPAVWLPTYHPGRPLPPTRTALTEAAHTPLVTCGLFLLPSASQPRHVSNLTELSVPSTSEDLTAGGTRTPTTGTRCFLTSGWQSTAGAEQRDRLS